MRMKKEYTDWCCFTELCHTYFAREFLLIWASGMTFWKGLLFHSVWQLDLSALVLSSKTNTRKVEISTLDASQIITNKTNSSLRPFPLLPPSNLQPTISHILSRHPDWRWCVWCHDVNNKHRNCLILFVFSRVASFMHTHSHVWTCVRHGRACVRFVHEFSNYFRSGWVLRRCYSAGRNCNFWSLFNFVQAFLQLYG